MIIIGIDPGTAITGFSIIQRDHSNLKLLDYGCIKTSKDLPQKIRLNQIAKDMCTIIKRWKPDKASVEKLFFNKNIKTAIKVSEARGVILQKLTEEGIPAKEYTPLEIKTSVCGYGKADKKMIQNMVKLILSLKEIPRPDDAADAIAAAICLANSHTLEEKISS